MSNTPDWTKIRMRVDAAVIIPLVERKLEFVSNRIMKNEEGEELGADSDDEDEDEDETRGNLRAFLEMLKMIPDVIELSVADAAYFELRGK